MLLNLLSGGAVNVPVYRNKLLCALNPEIMDRLELERIKLPVGFMIECPDEPIQRLIFIEDGVGSMVTTLRDGFKVEVNLFGFESVLGGAALIGSDLGLDAVSMQISGYGWASPIECAREEFIRVGRFHEVVLRYQQALLFQARQSVGCVGHHPIAQRLAKWLLLCADRSKSYTLPITHEYLGTLLGSNRSTVSKFAAELQAEKLIEYVRGKVHITDRIGLEAKACECYSVAKERLNRYLNSDRQGGSSDGQRV